MILITDQVIHFIDRESALNRPSKREYTTNREIRTADREMHTTDGVMHTNDLVIQLTDRESVHN